MTTMPRKVETGLTELDRRLDGGIQTETLATLTAPPDSQCNVLLKQMGETRNTLFVSTLLDEQALGTLFDRTLIENGQIVTHYTGINDRTTEVLKVLQKVEEKQEEALIILHGIDILERELSQGQYIQFINKVRNVLNDTGSIAVLVGTDGEAVPDHRDLTFALSELILQLEVEWEAEEVESQIVVPKYRGGRALTESIKVELTDDVMIDTSRDIA